MGFLKNLFGGGKGGGSTKRGEDVPEGANRQRITAALRDLYTLGGGGNFAIFSDPATDAYVQVAGSKGGEVLYLEAASPAFLTSLTLDGAQLAQLGALGWEGLETAKQANFSQQAVVSDDAGRAQVAELLLQTMETVYGLSPTRGIDVELVLE